jgi:hypothetical protein
MIIVVEIIVGGMIVIPRIIMGIDGIIVGGMSVIPRIIMGIDGIIVGKRIVCGIIIGNQSRLIITIVIFNRVD